MWQRRSTTELLFGAPPKPLLRARRLLSEAGDLDLPLVDGDPASAEGFELHAEATRPDSSLRSCAGSRLPYESPAEGQEFRAAVCDRRAVMPMFVRRQETASARVAAGSLPDSCRLRLEPDCGRRSLSWEVHAAGTTPLVGMGLLDSHSLYVEVEDGGRVVIEPTATG